MSIGALGRSSSLHIYRNAVGAREVARLARGNRDMLNASHLRNAGTAPAIVQRFLIAVVVAVDFLVVRFISAVLLFVEFQRLANPILSDSEGKPPPSTFN